MTLTNYLLLSLALTGAEWLYLKLARRYAFFEQPNERSMHQNGTTVRAGGFIFWLAALAVGWLENRVPVCFSIGLTGLALVSLWDDFFGLSRRLRLLTQGLAVLMLVLNTIGYAGPWYGVVCLTILGVALLNIYNFMDGLNGMTAFYSLVTVGTLWFAQSWQQHPPNPLWPGLSIALLIFSYLNARPKAICFAGDVGSITMGFAVIYGIGLCIRQSQSYLPVLFVSVYAIDGLFTILYRLSLRQNIMTAHRMHLYQLLVWRQGWSHLRVSGVYAGIQLVVNGLVLLVTSSWPDHQLLAGGLLAGGLSIGYIIVRGWAERAQKSGLVS